MTLWIACSIVFGLLVAAVLRTFGDPERVKNSGLKLCWTFGVSIILWLIWMIYAGAVGGFFAWIWATTLPLLSGGIALMILLYCPIDWPLPLQPRPDD